jgi:hypothetical protein
MANDAAQPRASRPYMPGYGILDENSGKGLLPWSWALERLLPSRNYWLSTTRPDGRPHSMPVWGVWLGNLFYFSTGRESRKAKNLAATPWCVVCPDRSQEAVVVEGAVEEVAAFPEFFKAYKEKYDFDMEAAGMSDGPFYVVRPTVAFGLTEGLAEVATRWTFSRE